MQPKKFTSPREKSKVCQFLTSLYGLKQSSRVQNCNFDNFIMKLDFLPTKVDPYVYSISETPLLITMIFMDNGIRCYVQISKLNKIINHLEQEFKATKLFTNVFVGLHILHGGANKLFYVKVYTYGGFPINLVMKIALMFLHQYSSTSTLVRFYSMLVKKNIDQNYVCNLLVAYNLHKWGANLASPMQSIILPHLPLDCVKFIVWL